MLPTTGFELRQSVLIIEMNDIQIKTIDLNRLNFDCMMGP